MLGVQVQIVRGPSRECPVALVRGALVGHPVLLFYYARDNPPNLEDYIASRKIHLARTRAIEVNSRVLAADDCNAACCARFALHYVPHCHLGSAVCVCDQGRKSAHDPQIQWEVRVVNCSLVGPSLRPFQACAVFDSQRTDGLEDLLRSSVFEL